jgi:hypothetical protein
MPKAKYDLEEELERLGSDYDKVVRMIEDSLQDLADAHATS